MPSHKVHCFMDREMFGKSYRKLHRLIDKPYVVLKQNHRVLFHDPLSALAIAEHSYPSDENAKRAALFHIQLDNMCSADPYLLKQLGFFAEQDSKKRKRSKKKKTKTEPSVSPEFKELSEFLKKILELQKLSSALRS